MNLVRLSKSSVGEEEKAALARVIDVGYLGMGREVQLFEEELRAHMVTQMEVICVNSGTAALHLAVQCLDIGPGDEVLVPSITFVASFQAISATGARPVACDVTPGRGFIDLADAARRVTPRTKAVMPVHYASDSAGMPAVYSFAAEHRLRVIEDAAHGFGGTRAGRPIGAEGDVLCFSFDGIKNITCGEGGAVVTGDAQLASRIKDARLLGVERDTEKRYVGERSWVFDVNRQGYRYHMSNLMAAIGRTQLKKLHRFSSHRRNCVTRYRTELAGLPSLAQFEFDYEHIVPHIFPVLVGDGRRDPLMTHLHSRRIETGLHYAPNHLLRYFATAYPLPVAERFGAELMSLPLHAELTAEEQTRVINEVRAVLAG
jgi:dTDP-4-amino-4,6-dideoxygalactose transaminase